jgi:hypothetical protein
MNREDFAVFWAGIASSGSKIGPSAGEFSWWKLAIQKQELLLASLEKIINILALFGRDFNSVIGFKFDPFCLSFVYYHLVMRDVLPNKL